MDGIVGTGHAGDGIEQDEDIFACLHHATATLDHQPAQAHVGL